MGSAEHGHIVRDRRSTARTRGATEQVAQRMQDPSSLAAYILHLQRSIGNQATGHWLRQFQAQQAAGGDAGGGTPIPAAGTPTVSDPPEVARPSDDDAQRSTHGVQPVDAQGEVVALARGGQPHLVQREIRRDTPRDTRVATNQDVELAHIRVTKGTGGTVRRHSESDANKVYVRFDGHKHKHGIGRQFVDLAQQAPVPVPTAASSSASAPTATAIAPSIAGRGVPSTATRVPRGKPNTTLEGFTIGLAASAQEKAERSKRIFSESKEQGAEDTRPFQSVTADLFSYLDQKFRGQWAVTGSMAMKYWSVRMGVPCRPPGDIDILVAPDQFARVCSGLKDDLRYEGDLVEGGAKVQDELALHSPSGFGVDVLRGAKQYGNLSQAEKLWDVLVIKPEELKMKKDAIVLATQGQPGKAEELKKAREDLAILEQIGSRREDNRQAGQSNQG